MRRRRRRRKRDAGLKAKTPHNDVGNEKDPNTCVQYITLNYITLCSMHVVCIYLLYDSSMCGPASPGPNPKVKFTVSGAPSERLPPLWFARPWVKHGKAAGIFMCIQQIDI